MFILHDLLRPLQSQFSDSALGRDRGRWFVFVLLAVIVPFTSSISSNLLRSVQTLFGLDLNHRRFYTFMASSTLPWDRLWRVLWALIPNPTVDGRLLVALDDSINPKVGRKIFACGFFHDHTARFKAARYPWSQKIVSIGLLNRVKGRWCCIPLAFRFYCMQKDIEAHTINTIKAGTTVPFETKLAQAAQMLVAVAEHFARTPVLVVCDSWFGNDGLLRPLTESRLPVHMLSRLRANIIVYDLPPQSPAKRRGRARKYGAKLGSVSELAGQYREQAQTHSVFLYGKQREVQAYQQVVMLKNLRCRARVVWIFRRTQWLALFTTDLELSLVQIIEYYGARWKIESGYKEIKQELGSARSQTRNAHAVTNHLNFCMMAAALTWIYADRIKVDPKRRHIVKGRTSFAFSDVRRLIANAALSNDFLGLWHSQRKPGGNTFVALLLRIVA